MSKQPYLGRIALCIRKKPLKSGEIRAFYGSFKNKFRLKIVVFKYKCRLRVVLDVNLYRKSDFKRKKLQNGKQLFSGRKVQATLKKNV